MTLKAHRFHRLDVQQLAVLAPAWSRVPVHKQDEMGAAACCQSTEKRAVLQAVTQNWRALKRASPQVKGDREIALTAVRQNGVALGYVSAELRDDREVVLAAVRQSHQALPFASLKLRGDEQVVLAACQQASVSLGYTPPAIDGATIFLNGPSISMKSCVTGVVVPMETAMAHHSAVLKQRTRRK